MTEEIPKAFPGDYGFKDKALVVTHPFSRFNADEEEIKQFLNGEHNYDDVFYVPKCDGRVPDIDLSNIKIGEDRKSRLPPGFEDGNYERGLQEEYWGFLEDEEAEFLIENYDEIAVAGAQTGHCVKNTMDSLFEKRDELYRSTEIYRENMIAYGVF